jgi:hypothetical protein
MNKEHYADYKWIKVKRYTEDESKSWEDRYKDLDNHHVKETTFLINEVRLLADKLDELTGQTEQAQTERNRKEKRADLFRSFFLYWFGFAFLVALTIDFFVDKKTQFLYHDWIFGGMILFGLIVSSLLTYCKWKKDVKHGCNTN